MKKTVVALLLFMGAAFPYVVGYHVEPVKAQWSGWAPSEFPNNYVSQTVTCNFDSLSYVELFAGGIGNGGHYNLDVRDGSTGDRVAYKYDVTQRQGHSWIRFDTLAIVGAFTKGKTYQFKFTRSGSDSIQFYYDSTDKYKYGGMAVGPQA